MGQMRISGLASNMDTDSIVKQLMEAHKLKQTKISNSKTKLEWKQEKWKDLNTKLYKLYNDQVSKVRMQANYKTKKATASDESKVKVDASANAVDGSHSIVVKELASAQYVTSDKFANAATTSTKLVDLKDADGNSMFASGQKITISSGKTTTGYSKTVELEVTSNTTISNFLASCTTAGLTASFDKNQNRMFISSKESGAENAFDISMSTMGAGDLTAKTNIMNAIGYSSLSDTNKSVASNAMSALYNTVLPVGTDKNALISDVMAGTKTSDTDPAIDTFVKETLKLKGFMEDKVKTDATSIVTAEEKQKMIDSFKDGYVTASGTLYGQTYYDALVQASVDYYKLEVDPAVTATDFTDVTGKYHDKLNEFIATRVNNDILKANGTLPLAADDTSNQDFMDNFNRIKTHLTTTIAQKNTDMLATQTPAMETNLIALANATESAGSVAGLKDSVKPASDCTIEYNGVDLTSKNNTVSVNGLTFTAISTSTKDSVTNNYIPTTISVENDVDATYTMIKDFFKSYNDILKEMNTLYDAKSARGYDPLTDDEREAMTDDQIEKWETKIKDSLFRRDDTLGGLISSMKMQLNGNVKVDGKSYSLSSFGICTSSDYTEKGLLHIYGDKDDATYKDKTDKLKAALQENPEAVITTLTTLTENLRETMFDKMSKTSLRSAMHFYNDKQIDDQLNTYKKDISDWDTKLSDMEDKYYKQFTAMEKAMASLQSQQSALSGLLGTK